MKNVNRTGDFFSPLPGVRGFCGVPRGGAGVRPVPGRGEMRRRPGLQNPLSSSGQTALYSGRPAGEGIPHAASLPLLFPTKPASLGFCGGPYRLRRKEKAPFDGVKRKDAGGGIPGFARNARGACYGGFVLAMVVGSDLSTASDHRKSWGHFRMPSASLFAAALWLLRRVVPAFP